MQMSISKHITVVDKKNAFSSEEKKTQKKNIEILKSILKFKFENKRQRFLKSVKKRNKKQKKLRKNFILMWFKIIT